MQKAFFVYLLASKPRGTLYLGVTSDLTRRVAQQRAGHFGGFTKKYGVHRLVWWERHLEGRSAIAREKAIKKRRRQWTINMLEEENPWWNDSYPGLLGMTPNELAAFEAHEAANAASPTMGSGLRSANPE